MNKNRVYRLSQRIHTKNLLELKKMNSAKYQDMRWRYKSELYTSNEGCENKTEENQMIMALKRIKYSKISYKINVEFTLNEKY